MLESVKSGIKQNAINKIRRKSRKLTWKSVSYIDQLKAKLQRNSMHVKDTHGI